MGAVFVGVFAVLWYKSTRLVLERKAGENYGKV